MPKSVNKYFYKAAKSQYDYVFNLLYVKGFTKLLRTGKQAFTPTCRAYCFILYGYTQRLKLLQRKNDGWLRLRKRDLNTRFKGWDCLGLVESGLLIWDKQYFVGSRSPQYRIPEEILEAWVNAYNLDSIAVNFMSGKPWGANEEQSLRIEKDEAWASCPERMSQAAEVFKQSYFDEAGVEKHLEHLRSEFALLSPDDPRYSTKRGALINDELCYASILNQNSVLCSPKGFRSYKPRYLPTSSGRISTQGGGFQSCSREMKFAAFRALEDMYNYDLESSQARICYYLEFPKYGINSPWLAEYVQSEVVRNSYIKELGIPRHVWKQCFSALLMGASLPSSLQNKGDILNILKKEFSSDPALLSPVLEKLKMLLSPLMPSLRTWHSQLSRELKANGLLQNSMGLTVTKDDVEQSVSKRGKMAAHILQGSEALIIQEFTLLSSKYGYKPIENQHDGLVVIGKIPEEAIAEVKAITGMHFFGLEPKQDFEAVVIE